MFCKNFLITNVIQFVSDTMIAFSQEDGTKIRSKQFSEFGSEIIRLIDNYITMRFFKTTLGGQQSFIRLPFMSVLGKSLQ